MQTELERAIDNANFYINRFLNNSSLNEQDPHKLLEILDGIIFLYQDVEKALELAWRNRQ